MAHSSRRGLLGRLMVNSCMLVDGCRDRFLMRTPYRTLDRQRFGMRMVGTLFALSAFCVFPLRLYASLPRIHSWLFSLMSASCLGLRHPAAMNNGWFPPVQAVSSAGLCSAFLEHHDRAFFLGIRWRGLLWVCERFPSWWRDQPSAAAPEARCTLMLGRLALLRTSSFDTWSCQLMPRMERKQRWWNRFSSLICFR